MKVVYVTPEFRFEVQRWDTDGTFNDGYYVAVSGRWVPVYRCASQASARDTADSFQWQNTLEKYRVVDTFEDEEVKS